MPSTRGTGSTCCLPCTRSQADGSPHAPISTACTRPPGDVGDDGRTPVFLSTRADGRDVITGTDRVDGDTLTFTYRILDPALDDDDVARVYVIAHLERFAMHYYQPRTPIIVLRNESTGAGRTTRYPDAFWLEHER